MRYIFHDHFDHSIPLRVAMHELGHVADGTDPELFFIDHDAPEYHRKVIERYANASIVLYPHGEPLQRSWDGLWEVNPRTELCLVSNPGNQAFMARYGYPVPTELIGWFATPVKPFIPVASPRTVLFAPIHPLLGINYMNEYHRKANALAFEQLLKLPFNIKVRYLGDLFNSGLWFDQRVEYKKRQPSDTMKEDLDSCDIVLSNVSTFLAKSVALGKPAVAFGQNYPLPEGYSDDEIRFVKHPELYDEMCRYPYDIENGLDDFILASRQEAHAWRASFIGTPFTKERLAMALGGLIRCRKL